MDFKTLPRLPPGSRGPDPTREANTSLPLAPKLFTSSFPSTSRSSQTPLTSHKMASSQNEKAAVLGMPPFVIDFLSKSHRRRRRAPNTGLRATTSDKSLETTTVKLEGSADHICSGWCLRRRLEDRRCSHRACQAPHPEPGTLRPMASKIAREPPLRVSSAAAIHWRQLPRAQC